MDAVRGEIEQNPLQGMTVHFLITRGQQTLLAPLHFVFSVLKLLFLCMISKCDVAHVNLSADGSTWRKSILALVCRIFRIPYVIHLHSGRYHTFWSSQRPILRRYIDQMFEGAAAVVVLGSIWADLIRRNTPSAENRVVILPNATAGVKRQQSMQRSEHQKMHILFLGRLGANKGIPELLRALSGLPKAGGWRATLAGDGDVEATRRSIISLGLDEQVSVPGWVDDQGTEQLLQTADVLVLPSRGENLPMSIVEAFAHGLAVVATPVGAIPDILEHEHNGLLVPVGDADALKAALERLLSDRGLRTQLGQAAKVQHRKKLDLCNYVRHLGEIWRKAATERNTTESSFEAREVQLRSPPR
jgi:glycosyltransferase involved in cell wall biosynthesis